VNLPSIPGRAQEAPTVGLQVPKLPRVNLLPPEIQEAARFRRFQLAMVAAGVGAVAIVAALGVSAHSGVSHASADLAQANAQQASLQSQLSGLQSVRDVYNQVAAKKAMLSQAMGSEIRWSYYLTDLSLKVPDHVWLTSVTATEAGTPGGTTSAPTTTAAAGSAGASALLPAGVGTVTFAGTAFSHDDVATWLDTVAKERGFANAYFTNSTKAKIGSRDVVNFLSSVTVTQSALSGRYSKVEG
jgi:Tfp pilus assembly protein PilN